MANLGAVIDGLLIIAGHENREDYVLQAEHDELYAGAKPDPESAAGAKLKELGWTFDKSIGAWRVYV